MKPLLEICVDSIDSAIIAQEAGADRIELCAGLPEGGTTPSYGTIVSVRNNLSISVNVIIRPRSGDFLYSDIEYDIMRREIDMCGELGANGIVIGILRAGGTIDIDRTAHLVEFAKPLPVTFHRAFDMCSDPHQGLEDVIASGAARLLTSGQKNSAPEGSELIGKLVSESGGRIIVMPGGGLNISNIASVAAQTKAWEFHLTGRKTVESDMIFRRQGIYMGGFREIAEFSRKVADDMTIRKIKEILESAAS
ncbi:MAG: copper homeostasis protein CutC [Bacteroidales bacterium]|jgi:copper homeostasis protein|nr:copper homeostasis protein CutC [Bacteroidales bacterium]MCU0408840.1 copper homeostasis protein CutC [Bacteroidales bacterium]